MNEPCYMRSTLSSEKELEHVIPQLTRFKVQTLVEAGHTLDDVSKRTGVSKRTVCRIVKEPTINDVDDNAERNKRKIGRKSKTITYSDLVEKELKEDPGLLTVELLRLARNQGYDGGKSVFYELVSKLRPKAVKYSMRFEGLPGEFSQHDFGEVNITFINGSTKKIHFFASRLKYSRWAEVTIVPNQQAEVLVRTLASHFEAFGGMPLLAVFDRPKTIALKWNRAGEVTEWNPTFASATFEMGIGVELCWPYSPNQKGSVERIVGWVKNSFFKQRRFHDEEDLHTQLREWLDETNNTRPSRATGKIPVELREEELPRLRPMKIKPENLALRYPVFVGPTATVSFKGSFYSMPPEASGIPGTLFLYQNKVRIVAGPHTVVHPRMLVSGDRSTLPEHRSTRLAKVSGKRGKHYLKRQDLFETGQAAVVFLTELVHRKHKNWYTDVGRLHDLLQFHGSDAMNLSFREAVKEKDFSFHAIARFLGPRIDKQMRLEEVFS